MKPNSRKKIHTLNNSNIKKYLFTYEYYKDHPGIDKIIGELNECRMILNRTSGNQKRVQIKALRMEEERLK